MGEKLLEQGIKGTENVQELGRLTVLEALAQETTAISANMSHRSTRQGSADYEDD